MYPPEGYNPLPIINLKSLVQIQKTNSRAKYGGTLKKVGDPGFLNLIKVFRLKEKIGMPTFLCIIIWRAWTMNLVNEMKKVIIVTFFISFTSRSLWDVWEKCRISEWD